MSFIDTKHKLEHLIKQIQQENTGPAKQLAIQIGVSEPTFKRYLRDLRLLGYPIGYCVQRRT